MIPEPPSIEAWQAWTPSQVAEAFKAVQAPWAVVGGWALDLWHGRETRPHEDIEVAVPRSRFRDFRAALSDFEFFSVGSGQAVYLPPAAPPSVEHHQNWVLDPHANAWRMDLFLEPGDDETWIYRKDESIREPRPQTVAFSSEGVPYLRPEFVLFFKARGPRPKDEADFAYALPRLAPAAREWLRTHLERSHPGHPWIAPL